MPKTKPQKQEIIDGNSEKINKSKSLVFVTFDKLTVEANEELRKELKKEGGEYLATKKTLLDISLKNSGFKDLEVKSLPGQIATIFAFDDEVAPAKVLDKFIKDNEEKVEFIGGILENQFLVPEKVKELAKLPSKQELYAKIVGSLNAPVSGFVNVLAGNLRSLVHVLKAIEEKKG